MSTEHQKYSTENQSDAIREYAAPRGIEIVRTYADAGKSGLKLDGRDALKQLIADVEAKRADFSTILVYDVSRWGRFQDADESAYYEYIRTFFARSKPLLHHGAKLAVRSACRKRSWINSPTPSSIPSEKLYTTQLDNFG